MIKFNELQNPNSSSNFTSRFIISFVFVFISQFALTLIPLIFPNFSLLVHLPLSCFVLVIIAGLGKWCKRLLGVRASAPAMVFFNVLFVWGVYVAVIRQASISLMDVLFIGEISLLIYGLYRIISTDPGLVSPETPCLDEPGERSVTEAGSHYELVKLTVSPPVNKLVSLSRIRYCKICKAYVKGFDHHCPAFGSCIGQNNHLLFIVLLVGFVTVEATYIECSSQFLTESWITDEAELRTNFSQNLAMSTLTFSLLQVIWQVVFLAWHVYCICYNIKTDEWINWKKFPEFQYNVQAQYDETVIETRFRNPYNKGIVNNLKEFMTTKD